MKTVQSLRQTQRDLSNILAIICICQSDVDDNATIQCDKCGRWQHMRCVGIDPAIVDLDNLVYYCDKCDPRPLDVEAAKSYIERYQRDEAQSTQVKPRRGRGKGSSRRGGGSGASPGIRPDPRRSRAAKPADSDETDDLTDPVATNSGLRDYTLIESYLKTDDATSWMYEHFKDYPYCPASVADQNISTTVKPVYGTNGQVHGLFTERDAPANAFVGKYMGVVATQTQYRLDTRNRYDELRGSMSHVAFVQQSELLIDARGSGNESRYIRKSCQPNCAVVPLIVESQDRSADPVWQFSVALKAAVKSGDELTIGFDWSADEPDRLPGLHDAISLERFARAVLNHIGDCACTRPIEECLVNKWLPRDSQTPRKRSLSGDVDDMTNIAAAEKRQPDESGNEQPMTREERKIQMAIARMESADVPKTKRRRRNTGDETRPAQNRRVSSMKVDGPQTPTEEIRRSVSPVVSAKATKTSRLPNKTRAKLIHSPTPESLSDEHIPHKMLWLRTFMKEKAIKEEQRIKLAEQAKEATARLAEEANRKKMEIEAQARLAREQKEREAQAQREKLEREAREASQRAREREIWGDHPTTTAPATKVESAEVPLSADHATSSSIQHATTAREGPIGRVESPTSMGPPAISKEASRPSPPAVIPKIVRKLSVSEYMRQRQGKTGSEPLASPTSETVARSTKVDEDKSDGEIEPDEVEIKKEGSNSFSASAPRGDFQNAPPTAPKTGPLYQPLAPHGPPNQSRGYPPAHPGHSPHSHYQPPSNARPSYGSNDRPLPYAPQDRQYGSNDRNSRPQSNGYPTGGNHSHIMNGANAASNYGRAPIPTGPKMTRPNHSGSAEGPAESAATHGQQTNGVPHKDGGRFTNYHSEQQ